MSTNCFTLQFPKIPKGSGNKGDTKAIITEGIRYAYYPKTKTCGLLAGDGIYFTGGLNPVTNQNYWLYKFDTTHSPGPVKDRVLYGSLTRKEDGQLLMRSKLMGYTVTVLRIITIDVAVASSFGHIENISSEGLEMGQHKVEFQGNAAIGFFDILIEIPRDSNFRMVIKTTGGHKWAIICPAGVNTINVAKQRARPRKPWRK